MLVNRNVVDANLVVALDALLAEQSVTGAAERLHTSPAAMSRTLARLRRVLGDPLLVRAGQRMVRTPRAEALRDEAAAVVRRCDALLSPGEHVDPVSLRRTFTVQTADLVSAALATELLRIIEREAPEVSLRFRPEELEGDGALRDGRLDLEVGVLDHVAPETRTEELLTLRVLAGVRAGHPLTERPLTPAAFAAAAHVVVSRRGRSTGPVDVALAAHELRRRVTAILPTHLAAMVLAARSDVVCLVPVDTAGVEPGPLAGLAGAIGLRMLEIPLPLPPMSIGMAWHPRHTADGGHGWLRGAVRRALTATRPDPVAGAGKPAVQ